MRQLLLQLERVEGLRNELFNVGGLDADAVEQHIVAQMESRREAIRLAAQHLLHLRQRSTRGRHGE
eukprot:5332817-Pleurochrysis_carterae.AAC.1